MKVLNASAIADAYFRFLGHFILLISSLIVVLFAFFATLSQQVQLLGVNKGRYDTVLFKQRLFGQKVDTIYADLGLLNTGLVRNDQVVEQRILREKNELNNLLLYRFSGRRPHEAYRRIAGSINELLVVKDSIRSVAENIIDIQLELKTCQTQTLQKK